MKDKEMTKPKQVVPAQEEESLLAAPWLPYLISFLVPIFVMLVIFAGKGIFPFGNRSFLRTDLYHQYAPFFQEYKDKLSNLDSLFYTWNIGLGTNFFSLFGYYLSSPLNWLLILCPRAYVIEFITYGIVLRMALSSLTLTWYLIKHNKKSSLAASFFGIFYGLSGYMAAYSWNIMWLDCLILFPMIILGLERLVKENRCLLYCFSLALCIISNYYISIMVCISVVLYFTVQIVLLDGDDCNYPKKILNFALYSLLAGGIAAAVLLPEMAALSTTASGSVNFPSRARSYFSMFDMVSRHLMNVNVEIGLDHWPNIYCGVAVLLFFPLYLCSKKVSFREKMAHIVLLIFFLLSFSLDVLNFIWHGFHYPNSLPCRQSFVYIFLLLSMGFKGFLDLKSRTAKEILGSVCLAVGFVILAEKLGAEYTGTSSSNSDDFYYIWHSFYLSIAFLTFYGGLIYVHATSRKNWKALLTVAALAAIVVESTINMAYTSVTTINRTTYVKDDLAVRKITASLEEDEGGDFFRVEKVSNRTKNDGAWLDYHSASIFSSTAYADLTAIYKKFGLESSTNAYGTSGSSWASNMLLGIRYSISSTDLGDDNFRKLAYVVDDVYMYKNTYALPLGFVVDDALGEAWNTTSVNPGENWNSLAHALGIDDDLFIPQTDISNNDTTTVTVTTADEGYVYIYVNKSGPNKAKVTYDDFSKEFNYLNRSYFIALDSVEEGTAVTITNTDSDKSSQGLNVSAYVLDEDVLSRVYDLLSREPMEINAYDTTAISATVTTAKGGMLFTSIPFDTGWTVYVDGAATETFSYEDAFLSVPVVAGTHTIRMEYTPNGFWNGIMISIISLILLCMITLLRRQLRAGKQLALAEQELEEDADISEEDLAEEDPIEEDILPKEADTEKAVAEEAPSKAPSQADDAESEYDIEELFDNDPQDGSPKEPYVSLSAFHRRKKTQAASENTENSTSSEGDTL